MAKEDLICGFVLDKSSSMQGLTNATIEGFNKFRADQLAQEGRTWLSLTLFNEDFEVRYVAWDLNDIPEMSHVGDNAYRAHGNTALYDAVAITIEGLTAWRKNNPWFDGRTLVAIWTDGEENLSQNYRGPAGLDRLNKLIADKTQKEGFEFLFMGAGQSSWLEAKKFTSIQQDRIMAFHADSASTSQSYAGMSASVNALRSHGSAAMSSSTAGWQDNYNASQTAKVPHVDVVVTGSSADDATASLSGKPIHQGRVTKGKPKK